MTVSGLFVDAAAVCVCLNTVHEVGSEARMKMALTVSGSLQSTASSRVKYSLSLARWSSTLVPST